jgi:hypothetical protein
MIRDWAKNYLTGPLNALIFDGTETCTTNTLSEIMPRKRITIIERDAQTSDFIKKKLKRFKMNIVNSTLSKFIDKQQKMNFNVIYLDFMTTPFGSRNDKPLMDILRLLKKTPKEKDIVFATTFSLRTCLGVYKNETVSVTTYNELFNVFKEAGWCIKDKFISKPYCRKVGSPMAFFCFLLNDKDSTEFTIIDTPKGQICEMLGISIDDL